MITVRLYENGDWAKIEDAAEPFMPIASNEEFDAIAARGIAATAIRNETETVACGGVTLMSDGEGFVWLKMIGGKVKDPIETARLLKDIFEIMVETMEKVNISTYILDGFRKGERLARFIGMKKNCDFVFFRNHTYNKYTVQVN